LTDARDERGLELCQRVEAPEAESSHRRRRMSGRDPHERHRASTPLELLFDLTFVVAFGAAGNELAHGLAEGHVTSGLIGFGFAMFAICWAWINFSWFASAYDTDDWEFRLLTMVQMAGVLILALGLPEMFESVHAGARIDNRVMVAGYVVMRVAMVGQWLRAMREDPERRDSARIYVVSLVVSQAGWVALAIADTSVGLFFLLALIPFLIETAGPVLAETRRGGTPWHPHHIAERYGLLAIITLGEGILGTVAAMSGLVHDPAHGWSKDAVIVLASGVGLTFGMWWTYFAVPWAEILHHHRERSFFWGYGHILIFAGIAATGAGLHVAQYYLEGHSQLDTTGTVLAVVVPVAVFTGMLYLMYAVSMRTADPFHLTLLAGTAAVLVAAVVLANRGLSLAWCQVVVALSPVVTVVGYEAIGYRHLQDHLSKLRA
jgi:low temperature requirement protein LtrA